MGVVLCNISRSYKTRQQESPADARVTRDSTATWQTTK